MSSVIIYGGAGALGCQLVEVFSALFQVISIDMRPCDKAKHNIILSGTSSTNQHQDVLNGIKALNLSSVKAVVCVAGGWTGGSASSSNFVESVELMWKQSVVSSAIAASLASTFLKEDGLLVLTGAVAALGPTPGMIGYGMAKRFA
jgi:dihydropteridine reductase